MEPNKFEQEFRDKLEQRTIEPSKMAWDRLDAMLSVNEEKEEKKVVAMKPNRSWMYMVASFVVFATIGTFFLIDGKENSGNGIENGGTSVVTTEKPVQYSGTNDTVPSSIVQSATDNISATKMRQQTVVAVQAEKASSGRKTIKQGQPAGHNVKENSSTIPPGSNENIAAVTKKEVKEDTVKDFEAEKLLIASAGNKPKKKPSIKVDANSLLSSVEGELNESFRDKALQGIIKNFNAVKTSVANRNYQ